MPSPSVWYSVPGGFSVNVILGAGGEAPPVAIGTASAFSGSLTGFVPQLDIIAVPNIMGLSGTKYYPGQMYERPPISLKMEGMDTGLLASTCAGRIVTVNLTAGIQDLAGRVYGALPSTYSYGNARIETLNPMLPTGKAISSTSFRFVYEQFTFTNLNDGTTILISLTEGAIVNGQPVTLQQAAAAVTAQTVAIFGQI